MIGRSCKRKGVKVSTLEFLSAVRKNNNKNSWDLKRSEQTLNILVGSFVPLRALNRRADLPLGWKDLRLGPPISGGPKILGLRTISGISIWIFVLVQRTFFTMPLTKNLYWRISAKYCKEWRWAFSFYGLDNLLLLRMCGTKRLNPFFQITRSQWGPGTQIDM